MPTVVNSQHFMKIAFRDELEKIALTRSGRKPIGVERLLEKEVEEPASPSNAFSDVKVEPATFKADIEKVSALKRHLVSAGAGAVSALALQKANRDRQMGRAMRLQQDAQSY